MGGGEKNEQPRAWGRRAKSDQPSWFCRHSEDPRKEKSGGPKILSQQKCAWILRHAKRRVGRKARNLWRKLTISRKGEEREKEGEGIGGDHMGPLRRTKGSRERKIHKIRHDSETLFIGRGSSQPDRRQKTSELLEGDWGTTHAKKGNLRSFICEHNRRRGDDCWRGPGREATSVRDDRTFAAIARQQGGSHGKGRRESKISRNRRRRGRTHCESGLPANIHSGKSDRPVRERVGGGGEREAEREGKGRKRWGKSL